MWSLVNRFARFGKTLMLSIAVGSAALVSLPAVAQIDTTAVTTAFADATTGVGAIAAVMLGVVAAGIAVKWLLGFIIS